jgi:hypothetical protein
MPQDFHGKKLKEGDIYSGVRVDLIEVYEWRIAQQGVVSPCLETAVNYSMSYSFRI